jgi:hypothetical protein
MARVQLAVVQVALHAALLQLTVCINLVQHSGVGDTEMKHRLTIGARRLARSYMRFAVCKLTAARAVQDMSLSAKPYTAAGVGQQKQQAAVSLAAVMLHPGMYKLLAIRMHMYSKLLRV